MDKPDLDPPGKGRDERAIDLARRLARFRKRVEAEGRKRSLGVIDQAISDAADDTDGGH